MTNEFAVEMRDVVKRFITPEGNEMAAVDHVTMQIKNGEFFSMLGSSGCGKTTSLRMIAGFEWPTEGEVSVAGPGLSTVDVSFIKNIPVSERINLQFRSEFFNLLNHSNFGTPNPIVFAGTNGISSSAGLITLTATTSRQIQFGLKLIF